ncbi:hypothetical protein LRK24_07725 [Rhodanobacter denitrificans]|uniref:hypothetical protein n=1 Tax=Rhodanobacter TaxID=75309 RepID=UPI000260FACF|nr:MULTISPECIES: hypothetical protein [Rhodanobacter]EIM04470.1 hypothetical protein UUC_02591 [Rhodanobacter denitrificans]UJJ57926.1 hypothetical protein LRK55_14805 [Rhodanobacter denitrificans]UJM91800.1 hypothetical protein LRK24_07725 [Rhodanobacter denitrificans]
MKKTSLLVALPAVALAGLLLSGCGVFRSHKAWDKAVQEAPLEIPPSLDRPSTSEALVIPPPGANQPTANGATARVGSVGGQISDGFVLADSVDNAYRRVGQVLESGSLGELVGHDDATHSYTLNVSDAMVQQKKKGFFGRLFGRDKSDSVAAPGAGSHQVQISVNGSGTAASEIRAEGNAAAVGKVVDALKSRLGG